MFLNFVDDENKCLLITTLWLQHVFLFYMQLQSLNISKEHAL